MANIRCKTNKNTNPRGKARVFFTCHPDDFDQHFERICKSIFAAHDCAIYYTEDLDEPIPEQELETVLGSNNLLVIPVTSKLLTQPNRTMSQDFPYAKRVNMPVLPIMMEPGLDAQYSRPETFGSLQYLSLCIEDITAISFDEKLRKYLETVLVSDEMAQRIRAAFDAYIFLSYRKKDRAYANELMRMIHRNPLYRDIAIWYDEFLTPGESFQESIDMILNNSKLFALLVTPNLLEEPGGKPNYVMAEEYPAAKASGIQILPAEMEATDRTALSEKYQHIPPCIPVNNDAAFQETLTTAVQKIAITTNNSEPEHLFLIGLAYLDGIDVESDRQRGMELITKAAESRLPEAMKMLSQMYAFHPRSSVDRYKGLRWAEQYWEYYTQTCGHKHPDTLAAMFFTVQILDAGRFDDETILLCQKVYALQCEILGETHPDTISTLIFLADKHVRHQPEKALELYGQAYDGLLKTLGEGDPKTISVVQRLAETHRFLWNREQASALYEKAYSLLVSYWGPNSHEVYEFLFKTAQAHHAMCDSSTALELYEQLYTLQSNDANGECTFAIDSLDRMAKIYGEKHDWQTTLRIRKKIYDLQCKLLGEENPKILKSLDNLIQAYEALKNSPIGIDEDPDYPGITMHSNPRSEKPGGCHAPLALYKKAYTLSLRTFGKSSWKTLRFLDKLADAYEVLGKHRDAVDLYKKAYDCYCEDFGEVSYRVRAYLERLSSTFLKYGYKEDSQKLREKAAALLKSISAGKTTPPAGVSTPENTHSASADTAGMTEEPARTPVYVPATALEEWNCWHTELQNAYRVRLKYVGDEDNRTVNLLRELAWSYVTAGDFQNALTLYQKIYSLHEKLGDPSAALGVKNLADAIRCTFIERNESPPQHNCVYLMPCGNRAYHAAICREPPESNAIYLTDEGEYPVEITWTRHDMNGDRILTGLTCEDKESLIDQLDRLGITGDTVELLWEYDDRWNADILLARLFDFAFSQKMERLDAATDDPEDDMDDLDDY